MAEDMGNLYQERLKRYTTAMRNEKPDRVPIRIFAAEFAAKYAGYTSQEVTHEYDKAFEAVRRCAKDFSWDATVINMVYVWSGLVDHFGQKYYKVPGIELPPDVGFQYFEPADEEGAFMKEDEYDALIDSPTEYLANIWMPRISRNLVPIGTPNTFRNNMAWLKGGILLKLAFFESPAIEISSCSLSILSMCFLLICFKIFCLPKVGISTVLKLTNWIKV